MNTINFLPWFLISLIIITSVNQSIAKNAQPITVVQQEIHTSPSIAPHPILNQLKKYVDSHIQLGTSTVIALVLCFLTASISSAGGIGGGGLYLPILAMVAGFELKTASSFSAFMVTGGSAANVISNLFITSSKYGDKMLIDFDITLLSEPSMLLGVSIGVIWNLMFPEWLITVMFSVFLAWSTVKTLRTGILRWRSESEKARKSGTGNEAADGANRAGYSDEREGLQTATVPLLGRYESSKLRQIPWMKVGMLVIIWFSFFIIYTVRGNKDGQSFVHIKPCGVESWLVSSLQIPLAIMTTAWIWHRSDKRRYQDQNQLEAEVYHEGKLSNKMMFPLMALLAGIFGGLFGIGGGMLISPLFLQARIEPQVTAATCSFMVFFSSTMSAFQYLLLGMEDTRGATIFALVCFFGSVLGLVIVQRGIEKHGRPSLIIFSVGTVMALSTILLTGYGASDVWQNYTAGNYMGFNLPC